MKCNTQESLSGAVSVQKGVFGRDAFFPSVSLYVNSVLDFLHQLDFHALTLAGYKIPILLYAMDATIISQICRGEKNNSSNMVLQLNFNFDKTKILLGELPNYPREEKGTC